MRWNRDGKQKIDLSAFVLCWTIELQDKAWQVLCNVRWSDKDEEHRV